MSSTPSTPPAVLVVDDDAGMRRALRRALQARYEVVAVDGGPAALDVLDEREIALILTDYRMPEMSGVELLRRSVEVAPTTVRILMSGYGELAEFLPLVDECDLFTFLPKPFELDGVRLVVRRAVERHLLDQRNRELRERLAEQASREGMLRRSFQQYVPPEVVDDLLHGGGPQSIVGRQRDVTVLLADLRGFTEFAEDHAPSEVVAQLNQLFAILTAPILLRGGTIDKYIGDAVLAHFGALRPDPRAADAAVAAAIEMRRALRRAKAEGATSFDMGIAICTGPCIVGNVGCAARMDHTVIGDTVNLVARLEELTKGHPNTIVLADSTHERLRDPPPTQRWATSQVRGRRAPVGVWELLDEAPGPDGT